MAENEEMKTPESAEGDSGKNTLMIVVVAALLLIGGVFLLNKLTGGEETVTEEAVEETTEEMTETAEEVVEETEEAVEETTDAVEETTSEAAMILKEKMGTVFTGEKLITLAAALKATKLDEALSVGGPYTILAPSEEAFKKLPAGTLESLLKDPEKLSDILKYHVIKGKVMSKDITNGMEEPTLQGSVVVFSKDASGNVTVEGAKVVKADVDAANGVIHVVDTVILPK